MYSPDSIASSAVHLNCPNDRLVQQHACGTVRKTEVTHAAHMVDTGD